MKYFILFFAAAAFGADTITLEPGEARVLQPGTETKVVCKSGSPSVAERFCLCNNIGGAYYLNKHWVFTDGNVQKIYLEYYSVNKSDCVAALYAHDLCK